MTFSITLAPTFLNELIGIPQTVFKPVSKATKLLEPVSPSLPMVMLKSSRAMKMSIAPV